MIPPVRFTNFFANIVPDIGDVIKKFVLDGSYILGPSVQKFESKVCKIFKCSEAVGCKSGTHAIILALKAAGVRPNDEVITVGNTYYATLQAIRHIGAKPVFCEINPSSGQMDPQRLAEVINENTRAILVVHLYGIIAEIEKIRQIATQNNLKVIEDCAHAFGTKVNEVYLGSNSEYACFSFYPTKTLGAFGDAGIVLTNKSSIASRLKELRYYADENDREVFYPDAEHARLDALQAVILNLLLDYLPNWSEIRQKYSEYYYQYFEPLTEIRTLKPYQNQSLVYYSFPLLTSRRDELIKYLSAKEIYVQKLYKTNLHHLPQFVGNEKIKLPFTEAHNSQIVNLSVHPSLSWDDIKNISQAVTSFFKNVRT